MKVLVIGMNGLGLMPCSPRKARVLLKENRAIVVKKKPFTIQLLYKTGSACQPVELGIDTGSQHIGVAIVSEDKVLDKAEYELRSSMEKRKLLETRKALRRGRRYRKCRYRKPKVKPHSKRVYHEELVTRTKTVIVKGKPKTVKLKSHWSKETISYASNRRKGWLPPSIQSKVDHHIRIISHYQKALPLSLHTTIEVAKFDVAKIKDPDISGTDYQHGPMYQHENVRSYVFSRDNYKCKICHAKGGAKREDGSTVKLIVHHLDYRSNGSTDNPDVLFTVCDRCHTQEAHQPGGVLHTFMQKHKKFARGYRDMTLMNIMRRRLFDAFPDASFSYGNITSIDRQLLGLHKSHANDAVAIAMHARIQETGDCTIRDIPKATYFQQRRKKKRSLHEQNPRKGSKAKNRMCVRNNKNTPHVRGFYINDKVAIGDRVGWISGFSDLSAYVIDKDGNYILRPGKTGKAIPISQLRRLSHNNGWIQY